jgi:histidyl-tRNA synthetase
MTKPTLQTLRGFRDFLPEVALKRQWLKNKIVKEFERFGFDPLETPAVEYAETLLGKYGNEADKLLYLFEDRGGRKVGLRYDQTVPLARVIAQYQNKLPLPFKRYQIQPVWRAENTQKGRYREFLQCDADIIGDKFAPTADAEILTLAWSVFTQLGFRSFKIKVNSRTLIYKIVTDTFGTSSKTLLNNATFLIVTRALDKLSKIGADGVANELKKNGVPLLNIDRLLQSIQSSKYASYKELKGIDDTLYFSLQMAITNFSIPEEYISIDCTMVRGLDYYTGLIFEVIDQGYETSLAGGGRYDNLIAQFSGNNLPAVGFAIGFDRTLDIAIAKNLPPPQITSTKVLIAVIENYKEVFPASLNLTARLRKEGINTELYLFPQEKLDKQLKYADTKGIPFVAIIGAQEAADNTVTLKNMRTQQQQTLPLDKLLPLLRS